MEGGKRACPFVRRLALAGSQAEEEAAGERAAGEKAGEKQAMAVQARCRCGPWRQFPTSRLRPRTWASQQASRARALFLCRTTGRMQRGSGADTPPEKTALPTEPRQLGTGLSTAKILSPMVKKKGGGAQKENARRSCQNRQTPPPVHPLRQLPDNPSSVVQPEA